MSTRYTPKTSEAFCAWKPKGPGYHFIGAKWEYWAYYCSAFIGVIERTREPVGWRGWGGVKPYNCTIGFYSPTFPNMIEAAKWLFKYSNSADRNSEGQLLTKALRERMKREEEIKKFQGAGI